MRGHQSRVFVASPKPLNSAKERRKLLQTPWLLDKQEPRR